MEKQTTPCEDTRPTGEYDVPWDMKPCPNVLRMKDSVRKKVEDAPNKHRSSYFRVRRLLLLNNNTVIHMLYLQFPG